MSSDTKIILGFVGGVILLIGGIVYLNWAIVTADSTYYPEAKKVCYNYKPAHAWFSTKAACLEVE